MKDWLLKVVMQLVAQYVTAELIEQFEQQAKQYVYGLLKGLAADTKWTDIDDVLVEKLGEAWGVEK